MRTLSQRSLRETVLAVLTMAVLTVAACGDEESSEVEITPAEPATPVAMPAIPTPAPTVASNEPQYGGTLLRAHATDPAGFDPVQDTSIAALDLIAPIYSQLLRVDVEAGGGALRPELAERWEVGDDGRSITFHLRQGVQWHDGQPFIADDVVAHFNRVISPPQGLFSSQRAPFLDVVDIAAPDASTVVFRTGNPSAGLLRSFAGGHYMVVSKHVMERETADDPRGLRSNPQALVGTGPFTFAEYNQGSNFRVERNPNYWDEGKPYLDGIEFFIMKDSAARFAALVTGRVHTTPSGTASLTPTQARQARQDYSEAVEVVEARGPFWMGAAFNVERPPFDDARVRQALSLAVDRAAYLTLVTGGEGGVGMTAGFSPPGTDLGLPTEQLLALPGYGDDKDADIARAKELLAEAGHADGFSTSIMVRSDVPVWVNSALFFQDQWRMLGLDVEVDQAEFGASIGRMLQGDFDVRIGGVAFNTTDPDHYLWAHFTTGGPNNLRYATDAETDRLLEAQRVELDPERRRSLAHEAEMRLLTEVVPAVVGHYAVYLYGVRKEVRGWTPRDFMLYNQSRWDDVWLREG
ncbi:MAG: ABC transporter substrate-binding protein [Chloroflexota bacterium]|nr:ABC transporter substrate-binding protein [Chloroflexota bacterium]